MKQIKRTQFTEEQLSVINDTEPLELVYNSLLELSANEDLPIQRKKFLMFRELVNFMRVRKGSFLLVGIKSNVADKLVRYEIKTLEETTKELKNVIS